MALSGAKTLLFLVVVKLLTVHDTVAECAQSRPFGMESGVILNSRITSSSFASGFPPYAGRLNNYYGAWCADRQDSAQYLQIDLGTNKELLAVATEGYWSSYIEGFYLLYSLDLKNWYCFGYDGEPKEVAASSISSTYVLFNRPIVRYVRINPTKWRGKICLKAELYGCSLTSGNAGVNPSEIPKTCSYVLKNPPTSPSAVTTQLITQLVSGEATTFADNGGTGTTGTPGTGSTTTTTAATTTQATTELTTTTTVTPVTWEPIDTIRIRVSTATAYTGQEIIIGVFYHKGNEVKYRWNMGNGATRDRDDSTVFNYEYPKAGIYEMTVFGYNAISNETDSIYLTIQDTITGLTLISSIDPMVPNTTCKIHWNIARGTNVTYTIKYGDATPNKVVKASQVGLGPYMIFHKYISTGHFKIEIIAVNLISSGVPIKKTAIVEKPLVGLSVHWILPRRMNNDRDTKKLFMAIGEDVTVVISLKSGTDPLHRIKTGEKTLNLLSNPNATFAYSLLGTYNISVKSYNHVSALSQSFPIPITIQHDEQITGMGLALSTTRFGMKTAMDLSMTSGTAFVCEWYFGDGLTAHRDVTNFNLTMYHDYRSIGFYKVRVCCEDKHVKSCVQETAAIIIPIVMPQITTSQVGPILINSTQTFNVTIKNGSDVTYEIKFGDGHHLVSHFVNTSARDQVFQVNHAYNRAGVYHVMVYASNHHGGERMTMSSPIIVQNPVGRKMLALTNMSPVKIPDGKVRFTLKLLNTVNPPSNVSCWWDFGDNIQPNSTPEVKTNLPDMRDHTYSKKGQYGVTVLCKNAVSNASINTSVIIYRMVPPQMTLDSTDKIIDKSSKNMYFPSGASVTCCVSTQPYDRMYLWSGFENIIVTTKRCISQVVQEPKGYLINVVVNNSLEIMSVSDNFKVQKKIDGLQIKSNRSSIIRSYNTIIWTATVFGTDSCFSLKLNDSSEDVIYGGSSCSKTASKVNVITNPIVYKHRYMQNGLYTVTIKGTNVVSAKIADAMVTVTKPKCEILNVTVFWKHVKRNSYRFLRSQSFDYQIKYLHQCYFSEGVDINWKLLKNSSGVVTTIQLNPLQTTRKEYLSFQPLDLTYGSYKVIVMVRLTGSVLQDIYGDVSKSQTVHFEIIPSPLKAIIKGGPSIMVDPDVSFTLDGGDSIDPDEYIPHLNLNYRWFCKRRIAHIGFIGCYSSNRNPLEAIGHERILFTISKELIRNTTYYFTLEVYKKSRTVRTQQAVFVSFGLPPKMKIMCLPKCNGRPIPSRSLVLLAECISCGSDSDVSISNKWEIAEFVNNTRKPRNTLPSETRYGLHTARLELLPNILTPGKRYMVILSAWKQGGLVGHTNYTFVAYKNTPPRDGNCSVSPSKGFAMDTTFVLRCIDWIDQDPPLSYTFNYKLGEETTILYTGDNNQRSFKLPIQEGVQNSTINITAEVQDSLGMSTLAWRSVLVSKPKSIDISNILDVVNGGGGIGGGGGGTGGGIGGGSGGGGGGGGGGGSGSGSGGSQNYTRPKKSAAEVAQLASLVAYSLNNQNPGDGNDEDKLRRARQLRENVALQLADVIKDLLNSNTTKVSDLDMVTNALRDLTKNPAELTLTALAAVGDALSNIFLILKRLADLARLGSLSEAERLKMIARIRSVATKILETISNIMMGIAAASESCETLSPFEESVNKVKALIKKALHTLDDVSILMLVFMRIGDPPFYMKTAFANLTLEKHHGQSISNKNYTSRTGSFELPETPNLIPNYNMSSAVVINAKVMEYKNVYQFCENPKDVTSSLIRLNLLQSSGLNYDISQAKERIEVNISQSYKINADDFYVSYDALPLNGTTRYHRINWTSPDSAVNIEFLPNSTHKVKWNIYILYGEEVLSSWNSPVLTVHSSNETNKVHVLQMTRDRYKKPGLYKVYLRLDLSHEEEELWKSNVLNISYSLGIYQSTCLHWDEEQSSFISNGCKVSPRTSRTMTQCLCKHLGVFGSHMQIMQSELGFDKAVVEIIATTLSDIVLVMVILVVCIYAILLLWSMYKDKQDTEKDDIIPLMDNNPQFKFMYEIKVFTGLSKKAGSTANMCCIIKGEDGQTSVRGLKDVERQRFQRAAVDVFLLCTPLHLGRLNFLEIWHDNTGEDPSWYLMKVSIRDIFKDELYYFMCNEWLAVEHGDGNVSRKLPVAQKEEVASFKHLFSSVSRNKLTDGHLWLSIFSRPSRSRFTRVQRLSCCMALVYCLMFSNAMFYRAWGQSPPFSTMQVGPLRLSAHQIYVGITSGLIMLPMNEIIVGIFRNIKEKEDDKEDDGKIKDAPLISSSGDLLQLINWYRITGQSETVLHGNVESQTNNLTGRQKLEELTKTMLGAFQGDTVLSAPSVTIGINEKSGQALKKSEKNQGIKFPYHFVFLGWFYILALASASAYFVAHFGMQYDEELAAQWLTSVLISLFQDIVIINGLRIILITLYFALVLKRPDECDYDCEIKDQRLPYSQYDVRKTLVVFPPSDEELEEARTKKLREIQMDVIIKDIVIYVFFLVALLVVSYSHRDPQAFSVAQNVMDSFIGGTYAGNSLSQSDGTTNYWKWLELTVLPSLSAANRTWAPRCSPLSNYSIDCNTRIIGTARLRQLRIPLGTCEIPTGMENVSRTCNDFYSLLKEDKSNYLQGWILTNKTQEEKDPWNYQSMFDIGGYPYIGLMATYSGGGYITELHNTGDGLDILKENSWIDLRTRALFVEVSVYNAQVDMFGIATFLTEWLPTNGVLYFNNVKAARLFVPTDSKQKVTTACQLFMVLFLMVFMYGESKKISKQRKQYFKDIWNWMEVFLIVFILGCLGALYQRSKFTTKAISDMQKNPNKYVSLIQAATFDEILTYFLGLVVFVANLKLLKLFRFNHRVFLFTQTLSTASGPLLSFMLVFAIFYIAFCCIYYLIFGGNMYDYRSMISTIESVFNILLGGFDFASMEEADRVFGPILFFSFMLIMVMILMNTFLTILMDAFAEVQGDEHLKDNELEVFDHFLSEVQKFRSRRGNKVDSLPNESISQSEDAESENSTPEPIRKEDPQLGTSEKYFYTLSKNPEYDEDYDEDELEDDFDTDDVLEQAIKRAHMRLKLKQVAMLSGTFNVKSYGTNITNSYMPQSIVKERPLEEKLQDISSYFSCAALDDITLDRAYEELLRHYVQNKQHQYYERERRRQEEFAISWQAPQITYKKTHPNIYTYTRHITDK